MRSLPLSFVSVVGGLEFHQMISMHLHSQQPPIKTLTLPNLSKSFLIIAFNPKDKPSSLPDSPSAGGILKQELLLKYRNKIPLVIAILFSSKCMSGVPSQWLYICSDMDNFKYNKKLYPFAIVNYVYFE